MDSCGILELATFYVSYKHPKELVDQVLKLIYALIMEENHKNQKKMLQLFTAKKHNFDFFNMIKVRMNDAIEQVIQEGK